jgi:cytochrome c oxidase assembly protein subunit 15
MSHFMLSMVILVGCVLLDWRAHREPVELAVAGGGERWMTRAAWGLFGLGAVTLFAGTAATAAGPHTGGTGTDDVVPRLVFKGADTLNWAISQHAKLAALLGVAAVALWIVARRRGVAPERRAPLTVLCWLLAAQGVIGGVQYQLELPAEIVWVHASLAAATWLAVVWTVVAAGGLKPRRALAG